MRLSHGNYLVEGVPIVCCPSCGEHARDKIRVIDADDDAPHCFFEDKCCDTCGAIWEDIYVLVGWQNLRLAEEE